MGPPDAEPDGASTAVAGHGRGSMVVVVEPASMVDGGPVGSVSGDTPAPEHAATARDMTAKRVMRRTGEGRLTGSRACAHSGGAGDGVGGDGGGGITGSSDQTWSGIPTDRWDSSQSASQVSTRMQPWEAGNAGTWR